MRLKRQTLFSYNYSFCTVIKIARRTSEAKLFIVFALRGLNAETNQKSARRDYPQHSTGERKYSRKIFTTCEKPGISSLLKRETRGTGATCADPQA